MAGQIVVRPCGQLEQYSTSRHSLGIYFGVSTTCRYHVPSELGNTKALRPAIEQAVAQVVLKQPFMRVGITGEDSKQPNFVHVAVIDLSTQIRWREPIEVASADAMLEKQLAVQLGTRWPDLDTRPPWKVTVVPLYARDGPLTALDIVPAPVPSLSSAGLLTLSEPAVLPPPQEELINFSISWPFFLRTLWKAFGPDFLKAKPNPTNVCLFTLPAATSSALLAAARANATTLTPLYHALTLLSFARRLPATTAPKFVHGSSISARRLVDPAVLDTSSQMAVLVTSLIHPDTAAMTSQFRARHGSDLDSLVWQAASTIATSFHDKIASLPRDDVTGLLKWVGDWHAYLRQADGKPHDWTWEVSNLGALKAVGDNGWGVTRAVFAQSALMSGPAMTLNLAGVVGGEISGTMTWQEKTVDAELVERVVSDLAEWSRRLAEEGLYDLFTCRER
ncbi:alcohol acetyltransferase FCK4 like protein [Verticillium longisporum]|nr:alcohol acetyltransferase FCK4 like protein [Verticillium longisporum]